MLKELKFVQGAVAKKDFVPALTHFKIGNGRILGANGQISLSSPLALDLEACPRAVEFAKAIQSCEEEVALKMSKGNRLSIYSGNFKAHIPCTTEPFPEITPQGPIIELRPGFLEALSIVEPFIGEDASRRWCMGVLFRGQSVFATNNVVLVEHWLEVAFPIEVNIPAFTVRELLRIKEDPTHLQADAHSITFHYADGRWMNSVVYGTDWPDLARILNAPSQPQIVPQDLFQAAEKLKPFTDALGRLWLTPGILSTTQDNAEDGAQIYLPYLHATGCYNVGHLLSLADVAQMIDLSTYPAPALFFGEKVRGAIIGIRQ